MPELLRFGKEGVQFLVYMGTRNVSWTRHLLLSPIGDSGWLRRTGHDCDCPSWSDPEWSSGPACSRHGEGHRGGPGGCLSPAPFSLVLLPVWPATPTPCCPCLGAGLQWTESLNHELHKLLLLQVLSVWPCVYQGKADEQPQNHPGWALI